ncbi:hypothetical protein XANCAGTX0491_007320 [Xanthoria calcicola]
MPSRGEKRLKAHIRCFANTVTIYDGCTYEHETKHGQALADAAAAVGILHVQLPCIHGAACPAGDGTSVVASCVRPDTPMPLIDAAADTGKWVAAILADFLQFEQKVLCSSTVLYTFREIADAMMSRASRTTVVVQTAAGTDVAAGPFPPR